MNSVSRPRAILALLPVLALLAVQTAWARPAPESFADLAERLLPAVVNISTKQSVDGQAENPFEELLKEFMNRRGLPPAMPREAVSLGSGFIVGADGYVVTNNHVVEKADEITVTLQDGTVLEAEVVGTDPTTDLALLKVKPEKDLPTVAWGDSDKVRVGDWVLAIGNPFGLGGTVTAGIVSAQARDIRSGPYDDYFQTDAAINRGNSGGPMFNVDGDVVGINTAIFSPSGGSVGIGFAIPANLARKVVEDLKQYGRTKRGWLGVRIQTVTEDLAASLGLDEPKGALVAGVNEDGPADKAGIKAGDVIVVFDGKSVDTMRDLPIIVADTEVGSTVKVTVVRGGKTKVVRAKVAEREKAIDEGLLDDEGVAPGGGDRDSQTLDELGLKLGAVTPLLAQQFNLPEDVRGVLVLDVVRGSDAARKGIRPGDVIQEMDQVRVDSVVDVRKRIQDLKKRDVSVVLLLVRQGSGTGFVALKLGDE